MPSKHRAHKPKAPLKMGGRRKAAADPTGEYTTVYLLCDGETHYIGSTDEPMARRLARHNNGSGSTHTAWMVQREHAEWSVARLWVDIDCCIEFLLKCWGGARAFCPVCSGVAAWNRARYLQYYRQEDV